MMRPRPTILALAHLLLSVLFPLSASGGVLIFDTFEYESFSDFNSPDNKAQIIFGTLVSFPTAEVGTATWHDGTTESTILWGRRDVYVANNNASGTIDVNPQNSNYFTLTSSSNAFFEVQLTYSLSNEPGGSPLNISGLDDLLFTYQVFDQSIDLKLALTDTSDTVAEATYNPFTQGSRLSLTGMTNWASLDKTEIKQIQLTFLTNGNGDGGDVQIDSGTGMAFATPLSSGSVPEPSHAAGLIATALIAAICRNRRRQTQGSPQ